MPHIYFTPIKYISKKDFFSCLTVFSCSPLFTLPQALNQLFEKIMALDIDERHLLRLGHGEEELETEKDFSR